MKKTSTTRRTSQRGMASCRNAEQKVRVHSSADVAATTRKIRRILKALAKAISLGAFLPADSVDVLNTLTKDEARYVHELSKKYRKESYLYDPIGPDRACDRE